MAGSPRVGSPWLFALVALVVAARADDYTVRFFVQLEDRTGDFTITVREKKAPIAAARFLELVNSGFFNGCSFFRVVPGFVVQFGLSGNFTRQREWDARGSLRDESHIENPDWNMRGTIAFAATGPGTRGTQVFVNYDDNQPLDVKGMVAFGRVVKGMDVLSSVYSGYRERPKQTLIRARGDSYLRSEFPRLSYIIRAQQVAFVEEPFALSKNATGAALTLGMVCAAMVCCALVGVVKRRMEGAGYKKAAPEEDFRPRADGEMYEDDAEEGEEGMGPDPQIR